ncbi:MAG TPA: helix-turn-helix domain-containing protein [Arenimonas sp.]|nr:helix-turn-helix domain-containing protein [Arenimonas sp.]
MKRTSYAGMPCPMAQTLERVGEWWSLLILRECFRGTRRFGEFERRLGIAKNVLSSRLKRLVEAGILARRPSPEDAREVEYRLTAAGKDLLPVLVALAQWGDRWVYGGRAPSRFVNRHTGAPVQTLAVRDVDGQVLAARDLALHPPDADRA